MIYCYEPLNSVDPIIITCLLLIFRIHIKFEFTLNSNSQCVDLHYNFECIVLKSLACMKSIRIQIIPTTTHKKTLSHRAPLWVGEYLNARLWISYSIGIGIGQFWQMTWKNYIEPNYFYSNNSTYSMSIPRSDMHFHLFFICYKFNSILIICFTCFCFSSACSPMYSTRVAVLPCQSPSKR